MSEYSGWEFESLSKASNYYTWIVSHFRSFFPKHGFFKGLDYGGGCGNFAPYVRSHCDKLTLYEPDAILRDGATGYDEKLEVLSDDQLSAFDAVFAINVLEHIVDDYSALEALRDKMSFDGLLFAFVPNDPQIFGSLDEEFGHCRRYSKKTIKDTLTDAGFRVIVCRRFNGLGWFTWGLMGRVLKVRRWSMSSVQAFDKLVPILARLERVEPLLAQSLVVVARKH